MWKIFKFGFLYLLQNFNLASDVLSIYNFYKNGNLYLFLVFLICIGLNILVSLGLGCFMFSKIESNNPKETYLKCQYFILLIMNTLFPPGNIYVFFLDNESIYDVAFFLYDILDLVKTILVEFPSIYLNNYQFFNSNDPDKIISYYFNIACLIFNCLFASFNILSLHLFTYSYRVKEILEYDLNNYTPSNIVQEMKKYTDFDPFTVTQKISLFIIFLTDFYGFSILWGIISQILPNFYYIIILVLFSICCLFNLINIPYFGCKKCCIDTKEKEAEFTFDHMDGILSIFCLPFGPLSLSKIYFFIKVLHAGFYIGYSIYIIAFSDWIYLNLDKWKRIIYYTGIGCLVFFTISYPIFLNFFNDLKQSHINETKQRRINDKQIKVDGNTNDINKLQDTNKADYEKVMNESKHEEKIEMVNEDDNTKIHNSKYQSLKSNKENNQDNKGMANQNLNNNKEEVVLKQDPKSINKVIEITSNNLEISNFIPKEENKLKDLEKKESERVNLIIHEGKEKEVMKVEEVKEDIRSDKNQTLNVKEERKSNSDMEKNDDERVSHNEINNVDEMKKDEEQLEKIVNKSLPNISNIEIIDTKTEKLNKNQKELNNINNDQETPMKNGEFVVHEENVIIQKDNTIKEDHKLEELINQEPKLNTEDENEDKIINEENVVINFPINRDKTIKENDDNLKDNKESKQEDKQSSHEEANK
jgi:hypothetical protein